MPRIIAIDFGSMRTGLAVTDNLKMIATSLITLPTTGLLPYISEYLKKEKVECIVIGKPARLDNTDNAIENDIQSFIAALQRSHPSVRIERMDERFTSKMAQQAIRDAGIKKMDRRDKSLVDKVSATLILQSYLDSINP